MDPTTWGGSIPSKGANVEVPAGFTVFVRSDQIPRVGYLTVGGRLQFDPSINTRLSLDTLITEKSGELVVGTQKEPIKPSVTAEIIFADSGAVSKVKDPKLLGRGALLQGKTTIYGQAKTAFVAVSRFPRRGDSHVTLKSRPEGWRVGDHIVIAGTDPTDPRSDEKVTITRVEGAKIHFSPSLKRDHSAPLSDLDVHVANLTRNVVLRSENAKRNHRGHVMFIHTNAADVSYASFIDLGRSDKVLGYNDHEFVDLNPFIPAIVRGGKNVRGRYPVHFHKGGVAQNGQPAKVHGSVVQGSIGWGFVNHSSHVNFTQNVTYDVVGGAYFTEAGDELGAFVENIALRTVHPNDPLNSEDEVDPDTREHLQDYGFQGDGFWFHGPNVRVEGNIVSGASGHGYIWWPEGLLERMPDGSTQKVFHDTAHVPNGELIGRNGTRMQIYDVPMRSFVGNQAYSATKGIEIFYLHTEFFGDGLHEEDGTIDPPRAYDRQLRSVLDGSIVWNVEKTAFAAPYVNRVTVRNSRFVGAGLSNTIGLDLAHFQNEVGLVVENNTIQGFGTGMRLSRSADISTRGNRVSGNRVNVAQVAAIDPEDEEDFDEDEFDEDRSEDEEMGDDFESFAEEKAAEIAWLNEAMEEARNTALGRAIARMIPKLERISDEDDFWDLFEPLAEEIEERWDF